LTLPLRSRAHLRDYGRAMSTRCYDTDLNDDAWAWIAPYLPAARAGGRPRTTDLRAVLNAIFYLLRTGCQWRLLAPRVPAPGHRLPLLSCLERSASWPNCNGRFMSRRASSRGRLPGKNDSWQKMSPRALARGYLFYYNHIFIRRASLTRSTRISQETESRLR
jgi:putative transposase